jgi:hypothetical protein
MKKRALLGFVSALLVTTGYAAADGKQQCLDAAGDGQKLRDAHKLIEARDKFRRCAAAECPGVVQSDCAGWLDAVEKNLPTVVLSAKTGAGAPVVDAKVTVDGQPFATKLDGDALPINPGSHTFHFEAAGGATHDELAVINEGGKNQIVAVVLGTAAPLSALAVQAPQPAAVPQGTPGPSSSGGSSLKTWGWVLGGVGVAGLAVGTVFGIVALSDKNKANCTNNLCDAGTTGAIKSAALVSDVGWIAGGLLTAGGLGLILFAPEAKSGEQTGVRVSPFVAGRSGGVSFSGSW